LPTKQKAADIEWAKNQFEKSGGVVISHYSGLNVADANELRKKLRESGAVHKVVKNTLAKIAIQGSDMEGLSEFLNGPSVISFLPEDFIGSTKVLADFAKDHEKFVIQGGYFDGAVASVDDVVAISKLPSRDELLAMLARTLNGPVTGLVRALNGNIQGLVTALSAVKDQKEAA
jgi:large subunit ribosomal protein L10